MYLLGCGNDAQFRDLCRLINQPQVAESEKYITNEDRVRNRTDLIDVII
jgi:crotonobetainyl-CoA:carnitine CoA-transferase CaiB-like acyl-CoA transferase